MDSLLEKKGNGNTFEKINRKILNDVFEEYINTSSKVVVRSKIHDEDTGECNRIVSSSRVANAEKRIASKIASLLKNGSTPESMGASPSAASFAHLTPDQQKAVMTSCSSTVSVITGGPGCGKTTVTKSLLQAMSSKELNLRVALVGPTNRAAKQLTEATGMRAKTIHRALGCYGMDDFSYDKDNPLDCDVVICDESSMVDTRMADKLLAAMRPGMSLIFVGDINQLPSIDAGQVLADIIKSNEIPVSLLTHTHRTAVGSSINTNAYRICNKQPPRNPEQGEDGDFSMKEVRSAGSFGSEESKEIAIGNQINAIVSQFKQYVSEGFSEEDIQILTPVRTKGKLGVNYLNVLMKSIINPTPDDERKSVQTNGDNPSTYSIGDRIMYCENDSSRDIYNGDIGYIKEICHSLKSMNVEFDGKLVPIKFKELSDIDHAIVNTVHKTQGGEFPAVIFVVSNSHSHMLNRQILYTGVTRGKNKVCIIGDTHNLNRVVNAPGSEIRNTMLDVEIKKAVSDLGKNSRLNMSFGR